MATPTTAGPTPIIDSATAVNSLVVFAISAVSCLVAFYIPLARLFPNVFPSPLPFSRSVGNSANNNGSARAPTRRPVNGKRMQFLLVSSFLQFVDCINGLVMVGSAWSSGDANFPAYYAVRLLTHIPAGTIWTYAMAERIVVIVVLKPRWKRFFLRVVLLACVYVTLQQQVLNAIGIAATVAHAPTPGEWMNVYLAPQWTTAVIMILPILSISGSLWSLQIAFGHANAVSQASPSATSGDGVEGGANASQHTSESTAAGIQQQPSTVHGKGPSVSSQPNTLQYPVTTSFKSLTVIILVTWSLYLITFAIRVPLGIRPTAIGALALSISLVAECLFETLLRHNQKKNQANAGGSVPLMRTQPPTSSAPKPTFELI